MPLSESDTQRHAPVSFPPGVGGAYWDANRSRLVVTQVSHLQPGLGRDGEGRTQTPHYPGPAFPIGPEGGCLPPGGWGSTQERVDYIPYLNGSFKRERLQFPWQLAGSITRRWLSFLPWPTSSSGIYSLPSLPFWIPGAQPVPNPEHEGHLCGWSALMPAGTLQAPALWPCPRRVREGRTEQHMLGTAAKRGRRDRAQTGSPRGFHATPGPMSSPPRRGWRKLWNGNR